MTSSLRLSGPRLDHGLGRRGNVQKREVRLAVLLDAEASDFRPQGSTLVTPPPGGRNFGLDLLRQRFDLLRA